jgi:hypothetical protein
VLSGPCTIDSPSSNSDAYEYDPDGNCILKSCVTGYTKDDDLCKINEIEGGVKGAFGDYIIHAYMQDGTLTIPSRQVVQVLIVAGGGAGSGADDAMGGGGGGGAGGVIYKTKTLLPGTYPIKIGKGGVGNGDNKNTKGENGGNSSAFGFTAVGGSGGRNETGGGSGGGGWRDKNGSAGVQGQGNRGGDTEMTSGNRKPLGGGGGGGSGGSGGKGKRTSGKGGDGGKGKNFSGFFGTEYGDEGFFASGGGGGGNGSGNSQGVASQGGGSNGGWKKVQPGDAQLNTGGGGGGAGTHPRSKPGSGTATASGGSGIVLIRYKPIGESQSNPTDDEPQLSDV